MSLLESICCKLHRREEHHNQIDHSIAAMREEKLKVYDALVARCPHIERKGKTMPYTSANGHMFSLFNKANEIGIRFSKEIQKSIWKSIILPSSSHTMQ